MKIPRILTVQDLSCVGQCSLTVALPILSAAGLETSVLPSAVLSTHTAGFTGFTCRDLGMDFPAVFSHWEKEKLTFDAILIGYLGTIEEIDLLIAEKDRLLSPGGLLITDPAMADNGRFYPAFDETYARAMRRLVAVSDVAVPNLTEACFLTGTPYRETFSAEETDELLRRVCALGAKKAVLTGVTDGSDEIGVATLENGEIRRYLHERMPEGCHGTGDIYSAVFAGRYLQGETLFDAAKAAADFTLTAIRFTKTETDHRYGAYFEPFLSRLAPKPAPKT